MQDQILRAKRKCPLDLSSKGFDGFLEKELGCAGQVDQIIGVNHQRLEIIFLSQPLHLFALRAAEFVWRPLARAGRKDLKSITTQPVCSLGCVLNSSRSRSVNPNSSRSQLR